MPQKEQLASMPKLPLPKRKGTKPSVQSTRSWGVERVKVGKICTLVREGARRGKGGLHGERRQNPRRKGRASKKSLPKSRRKHERVSGCKSFPG